jgi:hypothetical protein
METPRLIRTFFFEPAGCTDIAGSNQPNSRQNDGRSVCQTPHNEPQQIIEGALLGNVQQQAFERI